MRISTFDLPNGVVRASLYALAVTAAASTVGIIAVVSPLLAVAAFAFCVFSSIVFLRPELVAYLLLLALPMDGYVAISGLHGFFVSQVLVATGFVTIVFSSLIRRAAPYAAIALYLPWLLPVAGIVSLLFAHQSIAENAGELLKATTFALSGHIVLSGWRSSPRFERRFLVCLVAGNCIVVTYGLLVSLSGMSSGPLDALLNIQHVNAGLYGSVARQTSTFRYPTELAAYLVMTVPFILLLSSSRGNAGSRWYAILFLRLLLAGNAALLLLSYTRGAWIATGAVAILGSLLLWRVRAIVPLILVAGSLVIVGITQPVAAARFESIADFATIGGVPGRVLVWQGALAAFRAHPWTGVGLGLFQQVQLTSYARAPYVSNAENIWLTYLVEMGVVGTVAFAFTVTSILRHVSYLWVIARNTWTEHIGAFGATLSIVGILIYSVVDPVFVSGQNGVLFFCLAGLVMAAANDARDSQRCMQTPGSRE